MRWIWFLALAALTLGGCASQSASEGRTPAVPAAVRTAAPAPAPAVPPTPIVTPSSVVTGQVTLVNPNRFVVLTFPIGMQPSAEKRLSVYRSGLKVAELKITSMQRDNNVVADIIAGECRVGDEVRDN